MIGEREKAALRQRALAIVGILSVGMGLLGDAGSALGAGWAWRVFFGIACAIMDLIFLAEFAIILAGRIAMRAGAGGGPGPSIAALLATGASSALPVALASGPFLFAWASQGDYASLVRGLYAWPKPEAALASVAALRLFRLTLPFIGYRGPLSAPARATGPGRPAAPLIALSAFIGLCFLGGFLADAWLLPGYQSELAARRQAVADTLASDARPETLAGHTRPEVVTDLVAVAGPGLSWAKPSWTGFRADLVSFRSADGASRVWFDARPEHRLRAALGAALSLSALIAFALYLVAKRRSLGRRGGRKGLGLGLPTGPDELTGLLGR